MHTHTDMLSLHTLKFDRKFRYYKVNDDVNASVQNKTNYRPFFERT